MLAWSKDLILRRLDRILFTSPLPRIFSIPVQGHLHTQFLIQIHKLSIDMKLSIFVPLAAFLSFVAAEASGSAVDPEDISTCLVNFSPCSHSLHNRLCLSYSGTNYISSNSPGVLRKPPLSPDVPLNTTTNVLVRVRHSKTP